MMLRLVMKFDSFLIFSFRQSYLPFLYDISLPRHPSTVHVCKIFVFLLCVDISFNNSIQFMWKDECVQMCHDVRRVEMKQRQTKEKEKENEKTERKIKQSVT